MSPGTVGRSNAPVKLLAQPMGYGRYPGMTAGRIPSLCNKTSGGSDVLELVARKRFLCRLPVVRVS